MVNHPPKEQMLGALRELLHEMFVAQQEGVSHVRFARALGHADGYMRALVDAGLAGQGELLLVVAEERRRVNGPASVELPISRVDERAVA